MKRWTKIVVGASAAWFLIALPWLKEGVYIGSRNEEMTWREPGHADVRGSVLWCRYYQWPDGISNWSNTIREQRYFPGPQRVVMIPDGGGSFFQVAPEGFAAGCPVTGFWTWYLKKFQ